MSRAILKSDAWQMSGEAVQIVSSAGNALEFHEDVLARILLQVPASAAVAVARHLKRRTT